MTDTRKLSDNKSTLSVLQQHSTIKNPQKAYQRAMSDLEAGIGMSVPAMKNKSIYGAYLHLSYACLMKNPEALAFEKLLKITLDRYLTKILAQREKLLNEYTQAVLEDRSQVAKEGIIEELNNLYGTEKKLKVPFFMMDKDFVEFLMEDTYKEFRKNQEVVQTQSHTVG